MGSFETRVVKTKYGRLYFETVDLQQLLLPYALSSKAHSRTISTSRFKQTHTPVSEILRLADSIEDIRLGLERINKLLKKYSTVR